MCQVSITTIDITMGAYHILYFTVGLCNKLDDLLAYTVTLNMKMNSV